MKLDDPLFQTSAVATIGGALFEWWPLILAIPGAVYYILLIGEKISGKPVKDWFQDEES
jgi:hypothetical protein